MEGILASARRCMQKVVTPGDVVIDATLGNGYDTLFLAGLVEKEGHVFGFDIQDEAFQSTRERLRDNEVWPRVTFCRESHDLMEEAIPKKYHGNIAGIMFNLGYLPGSDKAVITQRKSTIRALQQGADMLRSGGRISVVAYLGHDGGRQEAEAVEKWARGLDPEEFNASKRQLINQRSEPPQFFCIEKK